MNLTPTVILAGGVDGPGWSKGLLTAIAVVCIAAIIGVTKVILAHRNKQPTSDEYRTLLEEALAVQNRTADELSEIKARMATIEKIIREVE
ncbi:MULTISPECIES: hypothetical protein [Streptomyces]|uniref:Uncharacterized protein n=3 Tax=Streptomyces TaxID=1883 RepID=A0A3S9PJX4_STRLT|nr:hypothetical protein [Streptomyces luteoverticillatus]AZQ72641.1 hypothetical protein EKH77_16710 [Streptomyces luteoverticillatus]